MRARFVSVVLTFLATSACQEPLPPIRYVTEKAMIGTDFDEAVCPYQLQAIDDQIRFVEDILGAPSDEKIEIYVYSEGHPDCPGTGCYIPEKDIIQTTWAGIDHEVTHAVEARFVDQPPVFWSEGTAEALETVGTHEGSSLVTNNLDILDRTMLDYATAGHFVRWLLENEDPTLIRRVLAGDSTDAVYARSIESLAASYEAEHPYAYPPWNPCDYPALPSLPDGQWEETIDISCDHPEGTAGENYRRSVLRSVELAAGRYALETFGGSGTRLLGCQMDIWEAPPPQNANGDVPNQVEMSQTAVGVLFESGQEHELELTDGVYKVVVATLEEREAVTVSLRRLGG